MRQRGQDEFYGPLGILMLLAVIIAVFIKPWKDGQQTSPRERLYLVMGAFFTNMILDIVVLLVFLVTVSIMDDWLSKERYEMMLRMRFAIPFYLTVFWAEKTGKTIESITMNYL